MTETRLTEVTNIVVDTTVPESISEKDELTRLAMFSDKYLPVFLKVRDLVDMKKDLEDKLNEVKEELGEMMDKYEVKSISNSFIGITRVSSSTSTSFDTTRFKKEEPELYKKLFKKYNKTSVKKPYTTIKT